VYDWDPNCLHYWGIVVYSVLIWLKEAKMEDNGV